MTYQFTTPSFSFLPDLRFLVTMCNGPQAIKDRLAAWADTVDNEEEGAWTLSQLQATCEALVVIAHANAAFSRATVPFGYRHRSQLDVADRGGYLAAKRIMFDVIDHAPLCNSCRAKLIRHVLGVVVAQKEQLERLIPRR